MHCKEQSVKKKKPFFFNWNYVGSFNNNLLKINGDLTIEFDVFVDESGSNNDVELIISYYDIIFNSIVYTGDMSISKY